MDAMRESWTDERLDHLNHRVDAGFALVDERFKQVDQRFKQVDQRFEQVDQRFEQMDARFDRLETHIRGFEADLHTRLDGLQRVLIQFSGLMIVTLIGIVVTQLYLIATRL